ncbi:MAG: hypothetical protein ISQ65_08580 [Pseudomonadales bacterium]|nr:hypothetical protein [Pseudomonadales bacterium]
MNQVDQWVGTSIGLVVGALIGAVIVQHATLIVAKYKPAYWHAYRATLAGTGAGLLLSSLGIMVLAVLDVALGSAMQIVPVALGAILQGYLYGRLIKVPDRGPIGLGKGLIVTAIQCLVALLLAWAVTWIAFW